MYWCRSATKRTVPSQVHGLCRSGSSEIHGSGVLPYLQVTERHSSHTTETELGSLTRMRSTIPARGVKKCVWMQKYRSKFANVSQLLRARLQANRRKRYLTTWQDARNRNGGLPNSVNFQNSDFSQEISSTDTPGDLCYFLISNSESAQNFTRTSAWV